MRLSFRSTLVLILLTVLLGAPALVAFAFGGTSSPQQQTDETAISATSTPETAAATAVEPSPFAPSKSAPLRLVKEASVSSAAPGQSFSYSLTVSSEASAPIEVAVRDSISSQLEVLDASTSSGSCQVGQTVRCTVTSQQGTSATVTIQVRVRDGAHGTIDNQASASASGTTAASDTVSVTLVEGDTSAQADAPTPIATNPAVPEATPTHTSKPSRTRTSKPSHTSEPNDDQEQPTPIENTAAPSPVPPTMMPTQPAAPAQPKPPAPPSHVPPAPPVASPPPSVPCSGPPLGEQVQFSLAPLPMADTPCDNSASPPVSSTPIPGAQTEVVPFGQAMPPF